MRTRLLYYGWLVALTPLALIVYIVVGIGMHRVDRSPGPD